jgi:hypothetical protein
MTRNGSSACGAGATPRVGGGASHASIAASSRVMPSGPVIAPRLLARAVHALLHYDPMAIVGDHKTVQIKVKTVLHRGAVDLGNEPARPGEPRAIEADALAGGRQLVRRAPRMLAAPAAHGEAELAMQRF